MPVSAPAPPSMKIAILSDIHGNLEALKSVIRDAKGRGVDKFICLGDIVGYGPEPVECLALIRSMNCPVIKGNHDQDASTNRPLDHLHPDAIASLEWTRSQLSTPNREWLSKLPYSKRVGRFLISHASPNRPNLWEYINDVQIAHRNLLTQTASLCFIGHTHIPTTFELFKNETREITISAVKFRSDAKYICNVGSVGQSRDGSILASYVIYDTAKHSVQRMRVAYDIEKTKNLILVRPLPPSIIERLLGAA